MPKFSLALLISFLSVLASCSSITRDDCRKDMKAFGHDSGKRGLPSMIEDVRKVCISSDRTVDLEAYQKGYDMGINEYCTPINGFNNGVKGDVYKSFCLPEKEELYHEKFLIGKKIYERKDQVLELEETIRDLESAAEHDLGSKAELQRKKEELRAMNAEIQHLEQVGRNPVHVD